MTGGIATEEGKLQVDPAGHKVHYWRYGSGDEVVIVLHGGPGYDSRYLQAFVGLAQRGLQVVLYDQLGSDLSSAPTDASLWRLDRFVSELELVREHLGVEHMHLVGHSFGGFVAQEYVLAHPEHVSSLVLSNTAASVREINRSFHQIREGLPQRTQEALRYFEAREEWDNPDYLDELLAGVFARHVRRSTPFDLERSVQEFKDGVAPLLEPTGPARMEMYGPRSFEIVGNLVDWDISDRLPDVRAPTLVISGWYDAIDPACGRAIVDRVQGSAFAVLGQSSHMVMLEREGPQALALIDALIRRHAR